MKKEKWYFTGYIEKTDREHADFIVGLIGSFFDYADLYGEFGLAPESGKKFWKKKP